jgi:hypothetical protein
MEIPDKLVDKTLTAMSEILLLHESVIHKDKPLKKLCRSYHKLLKIADKEYEHDFPYFKCG